MAGTGRTAVAGALWRVFRETQGPDRPGLFARIRALPRMLRAVLNGSYKGLSGMKLGLVVLSVLYIVSPLDAVPDVVPILGVTDDLGVALWLATTLVAEAGAFVRWERGREPQVVPGNVVTD